ncbi:helix-turn-helix domain-containing protein [Actinokineospora sp.]|uniref:helix-turn-helix domain-containing protein n=1 Tax=Actinokineospora sp. TaxID=1872133 RepID=UPI0040384B89
MAVVPPFRRRRLGRRLRELRESRHLTMEEAAERLEMTRSSLSRLESGHARVNIHLAKSMLDLYCDDYDEDLMEQVRHAAPPGWWTKYGIQDRGYIGMESEASHVREFSLVYVPGLLQTSDYMNALFAAVRVPWSARQVGNHVAARLIRQKRLVDEEYPLHVSAILDEAVLHRPVGGSEVMHAQLMHLVATAELETVVVQVLPHAAGAHVGMNGAFTLLSFPDRNDPDIGYVAYPTGAAHIEREDEVEETRLTFDHLCSLALSQAESVRFIEELARQYRTD